MALCSKFEGGFQVVEGPHRVWPKSGLSVPEDKHLRRLSAAQRIPITFLTHEYPLSWGQVA